MPYKAKSVVQLLKYQLGPRQAHAVVERLRYKYKIKSATARVPRKITEIGVRHDREGL